LADAVELTDIVRLATERYAVTSAEAAVAAAERLTQLPFWLHEFDGSHRGLIALKRMTSELIARLSLAAVDATRAVYGAAPLARYGADFVVPDEIRAECAVLKAVADRYVMSREETVARQATQREQLAALVDALAAAAPDSLEPALRQAYCEATDDAGKLRVVIDQVASLTDTSAATWFARWVR
jgi:dGTPase